MSLGSAVIDLRNVTSTLEQAVSELVMIAHEDRPVGSEVAIVDHLAETVSELQSAAVLAARHVAEIGGPRALPNHLPDVDEAVAGCSTTYWRDLRSYAVLHDLRRTASRRGVEWRTWQQSIELSLLRCEAPVLQATRSVRSAWQEVGELLTHYLTPPGEAAAPGAGTDEQAQLSTRRSS